MIAFLDELWRAIQCRRHGHQWEAKIRNIGDDYHWRMVCQRCRLWGDRTYSPHAKMVGGESTMMPWSRK